MACAHSYKVLAVTKKFLPYGRQLIDEADIAAVAEVLRGDYLTTGPTVSKFENAFADAVGVPHAVSCSSGTAALHLAAIALGLGEGDWVIVPSLTFLATANAVRYVGADVVFADVNPDTGLMTPYTFRRALDKANAEGRKVKAVFPVHLNGQCCDIAEIRRIADETGMAVVEDACHALGGIQGNGKPVGACNYSDMAIFSFHPVKTIAAGEAGMVVTADEQLADRIAMFRNHGMVRDATKFQHTELAFEGSNEPNPWYYEMPEPGYNYRLSDIHSALALSQLGKLEQFVSHRRDLVACYDEHLVELAPTVCPVYRMPDQKVAWHLYVVLVDFEGIGLSRAELMVELQKAGIGSQVHYLPVHMQPYYRQKYGDLELPGSENYYRHCLSLPLFSAMTDPDVKRVTETLKSIVRSDK